MAESPNKEMTLEGLTAALKSYESHRAAILEKAFAGQGAAGVEALEDEYQALQSCYFDLLNRRLVENSSKFPELMSQTLEATKQINRSIQSLENVTNILRSMAKAVDLVGRVLVLFGI